MMQDSYGPDFEHESARDDSLGHSNDMLRRMVQMILAIYLLPAILVVLAVGGFACVIEGMKRRIQGEIGRQGIPPQVGRRTSLQAEGVSQSVRRRNSPALQPSAWSKPKQPGRLAHRLE